MLYGGQYMGIWGPGNFEADDALNMLSLWIRKMIDEIRKTYTSESVDRFYDGDGDSHIIANIDIIVTLCRHYHTYPDLDLEEVETWKQQYLQTYDRIMGNLRSSHDEDIEFRRIRRENIVKTFDDLRSIVFELHNNTEES
jgi:hypothetical protein